MTKDEIQKVLDLSLEYYKSEIFGTGKESEAPPKERVDWIYERMKNPRPSFLDEAAKKIVVKMHPCMENCIILGDRLTRGELTELVKAGAEWMAGQGVSYQVTISADKTIPVLPMKDVSDMGLDYGDKVIVQIRKKD